MFRRNNVDDVSEIECKVISQKNAGLILLGELDFEKTPYSYDPKDKTTMIRARSKSNYQIWGEVAWKLNGKVKGTITINSATPNWSYYVINYRGGTLPRDVSAEWKKVYSK